MQIAVRLSLPGHGLRRFRQPFLSAQAAGRLVLKGLHDLEIGVIGKHGGFLPQGAVLLPAEDR